MREACRHGDLIIGPCKLADTGRFTRRGYAAVGGDGERRAKLGSIRKAQRCFGCRFAETGQRPGRHDRQVLPFSLGFESRDEIGIRDVVAEGRLPDLLRVKHAVGGTQAASGVVNELQGSELLGVRFAAIPDTESLQECDALIKERGASAFCGVGGRAAGGIHDNGRKSRFQASERRGKPGRSSANDYDIGSVRLTHATRSSAQSRICTIPSTT